MASIREYRSALRAVKQRLGEHADITAIGIGQKTTDGETGPDYAFVIGVEKKGQAKGKKIAECLKLSMGSFLTDVVEIPDASKSLCGNDSLDGSDLLISAVGRSGSLGVIGKDQPTGRYLGITAAHAVAEPDQILRRSKIKSISGGRRKLIGRVAHLVELSTTSSNRADLALIELDAQGKKMAELEAIDSVTKRIRGIGYLSATTGGGSLRPHFYVARSGSARQIVRCSDFTELRDENFRDDISGNTISFQRSFSFKTNRNVVSGHSGSLIIRERADGTLAAVGLLFAGAGWTGYAISWTEMQQELDRFNVEFE